jgi:hypothetical protein
MACRPTFLRRETAGVALSIFSTTLVQVPFLLHLVGTSEWQRLSVLSFGFGIVSSVDMLRSICFRDIVKRKCPLY